MIDPYCFPLPFLYECSSNLKYLDFVLGIIPTIIICFMGTQIIRYYIIDKNSGFKTSAYYFLLTELYSVSIISTNIIPGEAYFSSKKSYLYSKFSAFLHLAAQIIIIEQTTIILKLLFIKGSSFFNIVVRIFKYIVLLIATISSFSTLIPYDLTFYLSSLTIYFEYVVRIMFILLQSYTFIFLPEVSSLFKQKEIFTMKVLVFLNSLSFILWASTAVVYLQDFNILFEIGYKNMANGMIMFAVNDFTMEYLPKLLMACSMYVMSRVSANDEQIDDDDFDTNDPLNQTFSEILM